MNSNIGKIRFVYCPKCRKLLTEFSNIPVYKCGGCGIILKAASCGDDAESSTSKSLEENPVQNNEAWHYSGDSDSFSSSKKASLCSPDAYISDVDSRGELIESRNNDENLLMCRRNTNSNVLAASGSFYDEKEVPLETGENGERDSRIRSPRPNVQLAFKQRSSADACELQVGHDIQSEADNYFNEQEETSWKLSQFSSDCLRNSRDKMEGNKGFVGDNSVLDEGMAASKLGGMTGDLSKSRRTRSSHAYDERVSSFDDSCDNHNPNPWPSLSKRTLFKPHRGLGSKSDQASGADEVLNNKMSNNSGRQSCERKSVSLNENNGPIISRSISPGQCRPMKPTGCGHPAQEQGTFHESEVFHAVQNCMESEMNGNSKFPHGEPCYMRFPYNASQTGTPNYLRREVLHYPNSYALGKVKEPELDQMELLRTVEELRDQLSRLYCQAGKEKENQQPVYHNNDSQQDFPQFYGTNYLRHSPGMCGQRKRISQHCRPLQTPFSRQAMNYHHYVDSSPLNSYTEDQHFSSQSQATPNYNHLPRTSPSHICCHPLCPGPTIPHLHKDHKMEKDQPLKRHCRPIAGAAPFVVCYSCQKLLQVPADFLLSKGSKHKLQCSACSKVLTFSLQRNTHIYPYSPTQSPHPPSKVNNSAAADAVAANISSTSDADDCLQGDPISYSDDYGLSICKSNSTEGEPTSFATIFSAAQSSLTDKQHALCSSPEPTKQRRKLLIKQSGNESAKRVTKSATPSSDAARSEKMTLETNPTRQSIGSTLHWLMGYSSPSEMINRSNDGVKDSESVDVEAAAISQSVSQYHMEIGEEDEPLKWLDNIRDSSLPSSGKNEFGHGLENLQPKVFVNGKAIPDELVKKAEELAGPIEPGNYWYDFQAGFWGVMYQPCLGIIPPFIEEFNYPMMKDCAGGNTGILVNGRELHQKDLDLLSTRGFPTTKNRAYIIDIGGQLIDEDSGEELDSLGKLAPTVERLGHGFGMYDPSQASLN